LLSTWQMILVAFLAVTLGRGPVVILGASALARLTRERIPWSWSWVLTWGGLRGALPMVLVLSLQRNFPHRDLLVTMTFGVVLISILLQGLTMPPLLRWLGIVKWDEGREAVELARGRLMAAHAGLEALGRMTHGISTAVPQLREEYKEKIQTIEQDIGKWHLIWTNLWTRSRAGPGVIFCWWRRTGLLTPSRKAVSASMCMKNCWRT
jgi:Na+:H+ antiporter